MRRLFFALLVMVAVASPQTARAVLRVDPEQLATGDGGTIVVGGYSVPTYIDWDGDGVRDLVVGDGGGTVPTGKVRVYLNQGGAGELPLLAGFFYAQANGVDLAVPASGCLGAFPRVVQWDGDGRKDLLVGQADGRVKLFLNVATDDAPSFDGGRFIAVGTTDLDVGYRATPFVVDWNADGRKDLCVGAMDGKIRLYVNSGTDTAPIFDGETFVQASGSDIAIAAGRSSPCFADLDDDGVADLLTGDTEGRLTFFHNTGGAGAPSFAAGEEVVADDAVIDLAGSARSRPDVCDWNADGHNDVLVGSGDGQVRCYLGEAPAVPVDTVPGLTRATLAALPNPFNPRTSVVFALPQAGFVVVAAHDLAGTLVRNLYRGDAAAGRNTLTWDGRDDAGRAVAAGVYVLRMTTADGVVCAKAALVK